jgi:type II secretory pathway component GspD/PulD (secretin)
MKVQSSIPGKHRLARYAPTCLLGMLLCISGGAQQSVPKLQANVSAPDAKKAEDAYLAGARLLDQHNLAAAQVEFEYASRLNPARADYGMAFALTREHRVSELVEGAAKARMTGEPKQADVMLAEAAAIDPTNERILEHEQARASLRTSVMGHATIAPELALAPPIRIQAQAGDKSIHLRGDARTVITGIASVYGLKVDFDSSFSDTPPAQLKIDLDDVAYNRAMQLALKMAHGFSVPVDPHTLIIAHDTQENRARLERQVEETIYVPASSSEQLNELTNIVKNVFDVKQVAIGSTSGTILVRAPQATLSALNETLEDLIEGGSEVMLEIKLITVDTSRTVNTGAQTPTSLGGFNAYSEAESIVSANPSLVSTLISSGAFTPGTNSFQNTIAEAVLLVLSGAVTDAKLSSLVGAVGGGALGLTGFYETGGATFNFGLNSSDSRALDDLSVRVGDRQTATLRVGERYPITTATYSSGVSSSTASQLAGVTVNGVSASSLLNQYLGSASSQTIPQVQYEDLGLTLKTTPTVMKSGMVNMAISLKIEALTGTSANNIPVLSNSVFESSITVADGKTAMMISSLSKTESASIAGLPGLSELPGFEQSAADDLKTANSSELVLMVTPHIVRHRNSLTASRRIPFQSSAPQEF